MDTSIAAWQVFPSKDDRIKPFNIYLGHAEAVRQLAVQEKFSILLSLSVNGVILIHEVRSAVCLRKIAFDLPIRMVTVSEFGLVAVYIQKIGVKVFSINGTEFKNIQKSDVKFIRFSDDGEFLVIGTTSSISVSDVIEDDSEQIKSIEIPLGTVGYEIETFTVTSNKDQLIVVMNSEKDSKLLRFK
jgi:uncharacterized protein with WD repeat